MPTEAERHNKAIVLEAFDTLFNQRDYAAAERFWSPNYVQHSAHIEAGARAIRIRVGRGIDWDDGAAWMDALRAALDAAQREV